MGFRAMTTFSQGLLGANPTAWRKLVWGGAAAVMAIPVTLQLTMAEMAWDGLDFAVFGVMLVIAGLGFELVLRFAGASIWSVLAAILGIGGAFLMVMANLAVGIVGNEGNPINLVFFVLLGAGALGALAVRLRAAGLARVLAAMAAAQALLGLALALGGIAYLPVFTAVFVGIWLGSAALFRQAARQAGQWTA